jgi:hypothetical protein
MGAGERLATTPWWLSPPVIASKTFISTMTHGILEALHKSAILDAGDPFAVLATSTFVHLAGFCANKDITGFLPQQ